MGVYRRGNVYWVEFEFRGQRVRESARTKSKRKAEEFERVLRQRLHEQAVLGRKPIDEMTIEAAAERYLKLHLSGKKRRKRTAVADAYALNALVSRIGPATPLSAITPDVIANLKERLIETEKRTAATVNRYLATLRAILRMAHDEWNALAAVPRFKLLPLNNQRTRWLTEPEEKRLLKACERVPHLHDLVVFLIDTGARLAEATELTWDHVNLEVPKGERPSVSFMQTKSGKPRSVPLTVKAEKLLRRLHAARSKDQPRVFLRRLPGYRHRGTKPQALPFYNPHGAWKTATKTAELSDVRIHDLRHTFASRLVMRGAPLLTVSKLLGHSSTRMTERYAHLAPKAMDSAVALLDAA